MYSAGNRLININELAKALPVFGNYAVPIMGVGFIFAGFLALVVVSLRFSLGRSWKPRGVQLDQNPESISLKYTLFESCPH